MATRATTIDKVNNGQNDVEEIQSRAVDAFQSAKQAVTGAVQNGVETVQGQIKTIREHGVEGVKKDVTGYVKREPLKALLLAGGIGALTALILRR